MSKSLYWTKSTNENNIVKERDNIVTFLTPIGRGEKVYTPGQTVKTTMLPKASIYLPTTIDVSNSVTTIAYYDYTPVLSSSQIIVEFCTTYLVGGNASTVTDAFTSALTVNSTQIGKGYQQWIGNASVLNGTGTRSGTLFPLMGAYTNTDKTVKRIGVTLIRSSGDDTVTVNGDEGSWLKITELAP